MKAAFIYPNPRRELWEQVRAGEAPDTGLLGQNHMHEHGITAWTHEPRLRRRGRLRGIRHRLTWNLRELVLPWELEDADVAFTSLATLFPLATRVRRRPRVVLISYHLATTYDRVSPARRRLLRASLAAAARTVCVSDAGRRRLLAQGAVRPEQVRVVTLGVDESFWKPSPLPQDGYVLTVGRDLARDYATFARALEGLGVRAIAVASGPTLEGITLPPNVEVRFGVDAQELADLYAGASCVVLPIRAESYPLGTENSGTIALLEAMAVARPVVATERTYLADYTAPGETALTVAAEDPDALRTEIEHVLTDRRLAERLATGGRRRVEERHTTRQFAASLAAVFRELA